eukprot:3506941-Amphidinium_carterae.1
MTQEFGEALPGIVMYHAAQACNGDKDLVRFLADWDTVRMRMMEQPTDFMLNILFWNQVKHCRDFGYIFDQYENADEESYKKSYKWLRDQMDKALHRCKVESNLRQGLRHIRESQPRSAAPAAPFRSRKSSSDRSTPRRKDDRRKTDKRGKSSPRDRRSSSPRRDFKGRKVYSYTGSSSSCLADVDPRIYIAA